ncbi:NAD(P)-dependent alcohol dehydrogenase [Leifsonia poae]|uniref:NAD(P)-dependent alcohol dehydrogenase n=1 Tax=Leifsonia poae TaxID=110933 RepID=UPI001CC0FF2B|nr:NAD(P)-dependent alcohol dehydrogenase [Leifsonia poae]
MLTAAGEVRLDQRPVPAFGSDQLLVRVDAVGVCGSDAHYLRHGRIGSHVVTGPIILGHETAGTVVAVGVATGSHAVGDRVAIEPGVPCGRCELCRSGRYNLCPDVEFHATPPFDGTLQEYIAVRADFAFTLPSTVPTEHGALVEPLAVAVWACRKARVSPGSRVLVTGAGPVGLLAAQTARAFGATTVTVTDIDPVKRDLALALGADATIDARQLESSAAEFDVHIECSGNGGATRGGIGRLSRGGTAILVGMGADGGLDVPVSWIQERELVITGVFRYADCFPAAIELLAAGRIRVAELITGRYPLAEAGFAIDTAGREGVSKTLILPQV